MKMGFVSAILDGWDFEGVLDTARQLGFSCVEVACWPHEKAQRRYAGVSHIDTESMTKTQAEAILSLCKRKGIFISALAYYPNTLDPDEEKRKRIISHLLSVIDASALLKVNLVTTFIGRNQYLSVEENLVLVKKVWPPIVRHAKELGVRIAIENCPMLFDRTQWPGGQNLFTSPILWRECFSILDEPNLGINFDPSHFVWQQMDYIQPIYEFKEKLFHIHFKDIKLEKRKLAECGVLAYPLSYMTPKIPGLGDVDWGKFVSSLTDIGYDGPACIEVEDRAFEGSKEKVLESLALSKRYLEQFVPRETHNA
jgi:sugar phosphate isomerase/epimerase